jgi:hypothetical protein
MPFPGMFIPGVCCQASHRPFPDEHAAAEGAPPQRHAPRSVSKRSLRISGAPVDARPDWSSRAASSPPSNQRPDFVLLQEATNSLMNRTHNRTRDAWALSFLQALRYAAPVKVDKVAEVTVSRVHILPPRPLRTSLSAKMEVPSAGSNRGRPGSSGFKLRFIMGREWGNSKGASPSSVLAS